jgi:hypothetical protein
MASPLTIRGVQRDGIPNAELCRGRKSCAARACGGSPPAIMPLHAS